MDLEEIEVAVASVAAALRVVAVLAVGALAEVVSVVEGSAEEVLAAVASAEAA